MSNFQYFQCAVFLFHLLVCECAFVLGFKRRKYFIVRLIGSVGMCFFGGWVFIMLVKLIPDSSYLWLIPYYIFLFALTLLAIYISFDVKITGVLFAGTGGYATEHMVHLLSSIVLNASGSLGNEHWYFTFMQIVPYLVVAVAVYFIFARKNFQKGFVDKLNLRNLLISSVVMLITIIFSILLRGENTLLIQNVRSITVVIVCILVIVLQNSFNMQNVLKQENEIIERLLSDKKEQQLVSKENLEMINIKFHDIKQQLNALKSINNDEKRAAYIEEIEESILVHDTTIETGSETLDIVINEKSLFCEKSNIKFTYLINGEELSFMKAIDIYALFSNALGNAIESSLKENDEDKRIISLICRSDGGFVYVNIENHCSEIPKFINDLPVTTKNDSTIHGYGTKSIKHIVKKYGGHIKMQVQNDMFILEMLFRKRD